MLDFKDGLGCVLCTEAIVLNRIPVNGVISKKLLKFEQRGLCCIPVSVPHRHLCDKYMAEGGGHLLRTKVIWPSLRQGIHTVKEFIYQDFPCVISRHPFELFHPLQIFPYPDDIGIIWNITE